MTNEPIWRDIKKRTPVTSGVFLDLSCGHKVYRKASQNPKGRVICARCEELRRRNTKGA